MIPFMDFQPLAEFSDRFGEIRAIAGCSVLGRIEFWERLKQIQLLMSDSDQQQTWQQLYHSSKRLQHLVKRCLELNGIDPDWLSFDHLQQFLFHRFDEEKGEFMPGWLVELNTPPETEGSSGKTETLTREELIAAIALTCSNLTEALNLAHNVKPADLLMGAIAAQTEMKDPETREKKKRRRNTKKLKEEMGADKLKELINTPVENLEEIG